MPPLESTAFRHASQPGAEDDPQWPAWIPLAANVVATITVTVALLQREVLFPPKPLALFGLLAVLPWWLDHLEIATGRNVALPLGLFPLPVIVGVGVLVFHPPNNDFAPFLLALMAAEVATRSAGRLFPVTVGLAAIGTMIASEVFGPYRYSFIWVIGLTFGWGAGMLNRALAANMVALKEAQGGLALQAASDERQRIAREVHDVIAHSMTVTMLNVTAARMAAERGEPGAAAEALREAERHGRQSLADIRRTVGLLGANEGASEPPAPTAANVAELVGDFRTAGMSVGYDVSGDLTRLPPAAGLAVYRIAQESLGNAAKHASARAVDISLDVRDGSAALVVRNPSADGTSATGPGHGIDGMTRRAEAVGGTLHAGRDGSSWVVRATIPLGSA